MLEVNSDIIKILQYKVKRYEQYEEMFLLDDSIKECLVFHMLPNHFEINHSLAKNRQKP